MEHKELVEVDTRLIDANPFQARTEYPEDELKDLGRSIEEHGMLEPIIIRPSPSKQGRFEIAVGERRVRACRLVGIATVPAMIWGLSDDEMALYVPVENLQRQDLDPIEEARAFKILQQRGWTQERIAEEVGHGLTRDIVGQRLRLLGFPPELQQLVSHDTITPTHAEALARLTNEPSIFENAITTVVNQKLTSKETEQLVGELMEKKALRNQILEYLTGEEFLPLIRYLLYASYTSGVDTNCPFDTSHPIEVFLDPERREYKVCTECWWGWAPHRDTLSTLVGRIKELRTARNTPEATEN